MTNEAEQTTEQILTTAITVQVKQAVDLGHDLNDILESFLGGAYSELAADVIEGLNRMGAM
jgi:hypothetical protein